MRPTPRCLLLSALLLVGSATPARAAGWADARKAFREAQKSEDWSARRAAYVGLLDHDGPDGVGEALAALWKESNGAVQVGAMQTLSRFSTPAAWEALSAATKSAKGARKLLLLCVIADTKTDGGRDAVTEALAASDGATVALAAIAAGRRAMKEAIPRLLDLLGHKDWQVRAGAARGLAELAASLPADAKARLIDALETSKGSDRAALVEALGKAYGKDLGVDVGAWRALAAGQAPGEASVRLPTWVATLPVYGRRVALVVDHSTCTDDPHPFTDRARLQALCKVPGARDVPWFNLRTNGHFIAAHAKRLVADLPDGSSVGLVTVGGPKLDVGLAALRPATPGAKDAIVKELEGLKPANGMDLLGAMQAALDSGGKEPAAWASGPDELVVIACGTPWLAEEKDPAVVGATMGLRARLRGVPIVAVGVGAHQHEMFRVMATLSGGRYIGLHQ